MPVILSADGDVTSSSCSSYSDSGDSDSGNFLDSSSFSEDYTDISQSFSSDTELQQNASSSVPRARRQAPIDFGAADQVCSFCGAYFWMEERCKTSYRRGHPRYNRCCRQNRIALPLLKEPPALLSDLLDPRTGSDAKHFIEHIRKYNNVNALSSMGVKVVTSVNDGRGHYVFKISGQACHLMGSLLPPEGSPPKFAQLYIYDTANEIANRMAHFPHSSNPRDQPREHIITALRDMLNRENSVVQAYRTVAERVNSDPDSDMRIRICANRSNRPREYATPSADEVVGLLVGDFNPQQHQRDIIVQYRSGELQRISSVHPSYLALQYPIMFPYGEDSYRPEIEYDDEAPGAANVERPYMTMAEFYRYRFHFREGEALTMFKCGKLFQQVCVDVFACIDQARIYQLYEKQQVLRSDTKSNIRAAVNEGDLRGNQIGKRTILPASHVGGPRYQYQNYQDAIAVCKHLGHPHLFITFTCNPDWPEIKRMLLPRQHPFDRPDLICRVFKMRLDELIRDIRDNNHFGPISGCKFTL